MLNFEFGELTVYKSEFVELFSLIFVYFKNVILLNFANFSILANVFFWVECNMQLHGCVPIEGGRDTGAVRSSSI